jgi:hypothetical protein
VPLACRTFRNLSISACSPHLLAAWMYDVYSAVVLSSLPPSSLALSTAYELSSHCGSTLSCVSPPSCGATALSRALAFSIRLLQRCLFVACIFPLLSTFLPSLPLRAEHSSFSVLQLHCQILRVSACPLNLSTLNVVHSKIKFNFCLTKLGWFQFSVKGEGINELHLPWHWLCHLSCSRHI